jgi:exo-beta-1,3-glucanase (GH17 family)
MWIKIPSSDAVEFTISKFEEVISYTDKPVIITEMGWATCCNPNQMINEDANVDCQKSYIFKMNEYLKKNDKLGFFFEAFDEPWKGGPSPTEAEKHWGLSYVDRTKK